MGYGVDFEYQCSCGEYWDQQEESHRYCPECGAPVPPMPDGIENE